MRIREIIGEDTGHIQQDSLGVGTEIFDPRDPERRGQSPLEPSGLVLPNRKRILSRLYAIWAEKQPAQQNRGINRHT